MNDVFTSEFHFSIIAKGIFFLLDLKSIERYLSHVLKTQKDYLHTNHVHCEIFSRKRMKHFLNLKKCGPNLKCVKILIDFIFQFTRRIIVNIQQNSNKSYSLQIIITTYYFMMDNINNKNETRKNKIILVSHFNVQDIWE